MPKERRQFLVLTADNACEDGPLVLWFVNDSDHALDVQVRVFGFLQRRDDAEPIGWAPEYELGRVEPRSAVMVCSELSHTPHLCLECTVAFHPNLFGTHFHVSVWLDGRGTLTAELPVLGVRGRRFG